MGLLDFVRDFVAPSDLSPDKLSHWYGLMDSSAGRDGFKPPYCQKCGNSPCTC